MVEKVFEIKNLNVTYETSQLGQKKIIKAIEDFSLDINKGEIIAIAGESGCGKSTLSKTLIKLLNPASGEVKFYGQNIEHFSKNKEKVFRQKVQMIFQDPYASLNPKNTVKEILEEPLLINTKLNKAERNNIIIENINKVGLCEDYLSRYPHEFSGGQRQRIAIARAMMLKPEFIIADEPVSALDASIQAQIINLLKEIQEQSQITILFISHDLNVIKYIADRIGIMHLGKLAEVGKKNEIFNSPLHPYTKLLLDSIPDIAKKPKSELLFDETETISSYCKFYQRCSQKNDKCLTSALSYVDITATHKVLCHNL